MDAKKIKKLNLYSVMSLFSEKKIQGVLYK